MAANDRKRAMRNGSLTECHIVTLALSSRFRGDRQNMTKEPSWCKFLLGSRMSEQYTALAGTFPKDNYRQTKNVSVKPRTQAVWLDGNRT